jgi:hypothetical protein
MKEEKTKAMKKWSTRADYESILAVRDITVDCECSSSCDSEGSEEIFSGIFDAICKVDDI